MADVTDVVDDGEGAPAGLDAALAGLSDDELTAGYDATVAAVRHAEWQRLAFAGEVERRRMWRTDGVTSLRAWLAMRDAEGDRTARGRSAVARVLPAFPLLAAALADGRLSGEHVRLLLVLAGLTGLDHTADGDLVALGEEHTVPQLETACRIARRRTRSAARAAHARRSVRWWSDDDGTVHLRGCLPGGDGLTVTALLAAMAADVEADPVTGEWDPFDARCADALVEVCTGPERHPTERATVVVHVQAETLSRTDEDPDDRDDPDRNDPDGGDPDGGDPDGGDLDGHATAAAGAGGSAATWEGVTVSDATLRRLLCDTRIRTVTHDAGGKTVGIGRRSRTVPAWLAEQLRWRDQGCRFPGCPHTRWLHGHHIRHWTRLGPTNLDNLLLLCPAHHKALHEGGWTVRGDPDGEVTFTSPNGHRHTSRPAITVPHRRRRPRRSGSGRTRRRQGPAPPGG